MEHVVRAGDLDALAQGYRWRLYAGRHRHRLTDMRWSRRCWTPLAAMGRLLASFGLSVADVTAADAERVAQLWRRNTLVDTTARRQGSVRGTKRPWE